MPVPECSGQGARNVAFFLFPSDPNVVEPLDGMTPYNVKFTEIGKESFVIEWLTKEKTVGYIKYGFSKGDIDLIAQGEDNSGYVKKHTVEVKELEAGQIYYVEVYSNGRAYGLDGGALEVALLR